MNAYGVDTKKVCQNCGKLYSPADRVGDMPIGFWVRFWNDSKYCSRKCKKAVNNKTNYSNKKNKTE